MSSVSFDLNNPELEDCDVGQKLGEECHKKLYCRVSGFILAADMEASEKCLVEWRTGIILNKKSKVCFHHEKKYSTRYESLQKHCCDPMKIHKRQIKSKPNV